MAKRPTSGQELVMNMHSSIDGLIETTDATSLTHAARKKLDANVRDVMSKLGHLLHTLDPVRQPASVFDPSNPKVIGRFVALAMVAQPRVPLGEVERFYGSGVYAIYYKGKFPLYKAIAGTETPIYVGQAAPAVNNARTTMEQGERLVRRLEDHRKNISKAIGTLDIADFECRYLVVQSGWETAAEDYLIHLFSPIWNNETKILFGLGKHGDSMDTRGNKRSPWDTLHPGRAWAASEKIPDSRTLAQIAGDLKQHFTVNTVYKSVDEVMAEFLQELRQV